MTCKKHKRTPARGYSACAGCEIERLQARVRELNENLAFERGLGNDELARLKAEVEAAGGLGGHRELKARVAELLPFVEHIAGATCHCQQDRLQAEQNYHMPSCMVGQARKALAGRKEGCSRFPQAAETWVDEGLCHGCREDLELGRLTLMATGMGFSVSRVGAEWRLHEPLMAAPLKRGTVSSLSAALAGRKEGA